MRRAVVIVLVAVSVGGCSFGTISQARFEAEVQARQDAAAEPAESGVPVPSEESVKEGS